MEERKDGETVGKLIEERLYFEEKYDKFIELPRYNNKDEDLNSLYKLTVSQTIYLAQQVEYLQKEITNH
jgi:hypothetical protein